ncbi:hypothetical protein [Pseudomonas fluorescens]|uniref:hypothetical protein n=1 Tax=Pseudomonas fluorescens TaxID=294 RepID=UPI00124127F7|nr:hypothetical protein [Pseudomonas fluorescens]VVO77463.1 hypothetical protein PS898_01631 [Pseudomonas fluorescens]
MSHRDVFFNGAKSKSAVPPPKPRLTLSDRWNKNREILLFAGAVVASILLVLIKVKLEVPSFMKGEEWSAWVRFFQSKSFEDITGDMLTGLIAAYFFYVLIDLIPRRRSENKAGDLLSTLLSSIIETCLYDKIAAHSYVLDKFHVLRRNEIDDCKKLINGKPGTRSFLSLVLISKWSYPKFLSSLQLATSIDVDHARLWMDITDCVSRMKEHGDRADRTKLLGHMVSEINEFSKPETGDEDEVEAERIKEDIFMWKIMVRHDMKTFLELSEKWLSRGN